jgi:excinuclease UvrABC nuclease subunit
VSIVAAWDSLTFIQVTGVPDREGVYELADSSHQTIYIGRSDDLNRRLQGVLDTSDPCWRRAAHFRYELTSGSEQRQRGLLDEYYQQHERYPPCN